MKYKSILLAVLEITRATGNLEEYFAQTTKHFFVYIFPATFTEKPSKLVEYRNGKLVKERSFFWYKGKNKFLKMISYYLHYLYIVMFIMPRGTFIITYQPLFTILSELYTRLKGAELVLFVGDYFPVRTDPLVKFYHWLLEHYSRSLKYVMYPSDKLRDAYPMKHTKPGQHRDIIAYGVKKLNFERTPVPNLLGFVGNLRPQQGVELIFETLKNNRELKLEIMGGGAMLEDLKLLAKTLHIDNRVKFHGFVKEEDIIPIVSRWEMGMAPYEPSENNLSFYAEPSKIKLYMQYQLPIVMTKITYIAPELEKAKAGESIEYTAADMLRAIKKIQDNYPTYADGVKEVVEKYEYKKYYDQKFGFLKYP